MSGRYGGNIKGKRVNRNRGPSSGQRRSFTEALGRIVSTPIPNATILGRNAPDSGVEVKDKAPATN